jgi:molybdopterin converting factor small subunit
MKDQMAINVRFYGSFRRYGDKTTLHVPKNSDLSVIRRLLTERLGEKEKALIYDSAFANDDRILSEGDTVHQDATLSILPPVCGG